MIHALLHLPQGGFTQQVDLDGLGERLADKRAVVWLDIQDASQEDVDLLRRQFGFHELALEDALHLHQRPKLEEYEQFYFLVFYSLRLKADGDLEATELDLFVGGNYVVAVHRAAIPEIEEGLRRWERSHESQGHGIGGLVHSLLDTLVDGYFDVADGIAEQVTDLEERIVRGADRHAAERVLALKRRLLAMRRILGPERDALNALMRQDIPLLDQQTLVYLRDVYDHLVRIADTVDLQGDLLTSALDVHLGAVSNRLNQSMKTLTSVTIILMTMGLIAGIYGMNFHNMPELSWDLGYAWALGLMAATAGGLYLYLKRKGWL